MLLAALALVATGIHQSDSWAQVWAKLEHLLADEASASETTVLQSQLAAALHEAGTGPRTELLRAALEALQGRDSSAVAARLAALEPTPFDAREQWFLAELLGPGPARVRAVLAALEAPTDLSRWQILLAWNTAVDEARGLRYEKATLPIQLEMHRRYQADWSALDLALTYKSLGQYEAADIVIAETIAREEAAGRRPSALWEQRGILALGSGNERAARDYFGKALALGSDDAGLVLSRLDLMQGRIAAARRGFRAVLTNQPPPDWAWRGWGTALLPPAFAAPAARHVSNP